MSVPAFHPQEFCLKQFDTINTCDLSSIWEWVNGSTTANIEISNVRPASRSKISSIARTKWTPQCFELRHFGMLRIHARRGDRFQNRMVFKTSDCLQHLVCRDKLAAPRCHTSVGRHFSSVMSNQFPMIFENV
jgi:hypothetical protein